MSEIYWLTRLDSIVSMGEVLIGLPIIVTFMVFLYWLLGNSNFKIMKWIKTASIFIFLGILIEVFVPTTKEAMAIWGIGETIDYIKSNDKAKQLPDKCVDALDKFIEEYVEDK